MKTDQYLTPADLVGRLTIDADFSGWDYGYRDNSLQIRLLFDGIVIDSVNVGIEPVGFVREQSDY